MLFLYIYYKYNCLNFIFMKFNSHLYIYLVSCNLDKLIYYSFLVNFSRFSTYKIVSFANTEIEIVLLFPLQSVCELCVYVYVCVCVCVSNFFG